MRTAVLLLLAMAVNLQPGGAVQNGIDAQRLARIPARMQEFVDEGKIAGAVMVLARNDGIVLLEAVGYKNLQAREPMPTDAIFVMKSVAKPMTALGIMVLQEEGRLSINDRLAVHLPAFAQLSVEGATERTRPVILRNLLTHTSGMARENLLMPPDAMERSLASVVAQYAQSPLAAAPGERFIYSSPGIDTLGRVIEVVSGKSYEAFMDERIFGPLGMDDTGFFVVPEERQRLPSFYRIEDGRLLEGARPNSYAGDLPHEGRVFPAPAFGLYSTAPDLGALLQMLLSNGAYDGGRVLSPASVGVMTVDQIGDDNKPARGLGWEVARRAGTFGGPLASSRAYGHGGSTGVFVWVDPHHDLAGAFLVHQASQESRMAREIFVNMAITAVTDR